MTGLKLLFGSKLEVLADAQHGYAVSKAVGEALVARAIQGGSGLATTLHMAPKLQTCHRPLFLHSSLGHGCRGQQNRLLQPN